MRPKAILFLTLILILFGYVFGYEYKGVKNIGKDVVRNYQLADKYFNKGERKFHKKNYARAEKDLEKCIDVFPMHADAQYYLSLVYYKKNDYPGALEYIEKAKTNVERLNELKAHIKKETKTKLKEYHKDLLDGKYVGYFVDNNECMIPMGERVSRLKATQLEAIMDMTGRSEIEAPANYFFVHGNIFFKLKRYKEAVNQYVEVIKRAPNHGGAYNNLATLFYMGGKKGMALYCLGQAEACGFKVDPRFKKVLTL
jgi:tetratricopeptide (TPR) repeat protein